jgi:hypothetical protein
MEVRAWRRVPDAAGALRQMQSFARDVIPAVT